MLKYKATELLTSNLGRGVLIDYASYADKKGIEYNSFTSHEIKLSEILEIATSCNITFQSGDILFVRVGVTRDWDNRMTVSDKMAYATNAIPHVAGVEATTDILRWIWDTGFAAVAGDSIAFEVWPPRSDVMLHEYLLAGWGMPIGKKHTYIFDEYDRADLDIFQANSLTLKS